LNELQIGLLIVIVTTAVLFSGFPIAWGLALVSVVFLVVFKGPTSLTVIATQFMDELNSFAMVTIPLFVLLGAAVGVSAAGKDIYNSLYRWLSRVPGGLIIANILACGMFSAVCGSSPATAAAIGKAGVPEMIKRGVPPSMATGAICAGGTLGILIPPSITMILYGLATDTSIGRLFLSGVIPGALLVLLFSVYAWLATLAASREMPVVNERFTLKEKSEGLVRVAPFLAIMIAIAYFMYGGVATPSEIAAIAALLALVLVMTIYGAWRPRDLWLIFRDTVRESSMILMIIAAAALFSYMMSLLYVSQTSAEWLVSLQMNRWVLMFFINVFMLVLGCFLPPVAIILMLMPILTPVLEANQFDLIWFAVILTINMEVGLITPPVGLNLYVLRGVAPQVPLTVILRGSMPYVVIMLAFMVAMSIFPEIATWLPDKLMGPGR
jgi:tripartite ATP-independent transporter DctM subunit